MRIYTIQKKEVLDTILSIGIAHPNDIPMWEELEYAYAWMSEKMVSKIGSKNKQSKYPFWGFIKEEHFCEGWSENEYYLTLDVPDSEVVLSCYHKWHRIMHESMFLDCEHDGYNPDIKLKAKKRDSLLFKITKNIVPQATFWAITKDMLVSYVKVSETKLGSFKNEE